MPVGSSSTASTAAATAYAVQAQPFQPYAPMLPATPNSVHSSPAYSTSSSSSNVQQQQNAATTAAAAAAMHLHFMSPPAHNFVGHQFRPMLSAGMHHSMAAAAAAAAAAVASSVDTQQMAGGLGAFRKYCYLAQFGLFNCDCFDTGIGGRVGDPNRTGLSACCRRHSCVGRYRFWSL